jgi:hypothetical protein
MGAITNPPSPNIEAKSTASKRPTRIARVSSLPPPATQERARLLPGGGEAATIQRSRGAMAAPEAPACYVGIARQSAAFRLMKQMVRDLTSSYRPRACFFVG